MLGYSLLVIVISLISISYAAHKCGNPSLGPVLGGVDFVAMFNKYSQNQTITNAELPLMGDAKYSSSIGKYSFWFKSAQNLAEFELSPAKYAPQFGGYCAWGLTGDDIHVSDPSGYSLGGACLNSTNGFLFFTSQNTIQNIWYLLLEAKYDMEQTGESLEANLQKSRVNYAKVLEENNVTECYNTNNLNRCE